MFYFVLIRKLFKTHFRKIKSAKSCLWRIRTNRAKQIKVWCCNSGHCEGQNSAKKFDYVRVLMFKHFLSLPFLRPIRANVLWLTWTFAGRHFELHTRRFPLLRELINWSNQLTSILRSRTQNKSFFAQLHNFSNWIYLFFPSSQRSTELADDFL